MTAADDFQHNWIGLFEALPSYLPGARFSRNGDFYIGTTGLWTASLNVALAVHESAITPDALGELPLIFADAGGLPFSVHFTTRQAVPDCAPLLRRHGYVDFFGDPVMWRDSLLEATVNKAITVLPVIGREDEASYREVSTKGFDLPPSIEPEFFHIMLTLPYFHPMLAWLDGKPIGAGTLLYTKGIAAIYNVVTLPDMQRRGAATAMMDALQRQALTDGYKRTVLQSSPQGLSLYQRLGFRIDGYQVGYQYIG